MAMAMVRARVRVRVRTSPRRVTSGSWLGDVTMGEDTWGAVRLGVHRREAQKHEAPLGLP